MSACAGLLGLDDVAFQAGDAGSSADGAPPGDAPVGDAPSRVDSGRWCDLHPDDAGADVVVCDDFDGVELASSTWNGKIGSLERSDADPQTPSSPFTLEVVQDNGNKSEITLALPSDKRTIWLEADLRVVSPGTGQIDVLQVTADPGDFTFALIFDTAQNKWLLERNCVGFQGCYLLQDTNSTFDTWKHVKLEVSLDGFGGSIVVNGVTVAASGAYDASPKGPIVVHLGLPYVNNASAWRVRFDNVVVRAF